MEVVIEGERQLDTELFHDDFAGAVCEAPAFIVELLEGLPCKRQISGSNLVDFRKFIVEEFCAQQQCPFLSPRTLSSVSISSMT